MAHLDYNINKPCSPWNIHNISPESDVIPKEPSYPPPGIQKLLDSIPTAYGVVVPNKEIKKEKKKNKIHINKSNKVISKNINNDYIKNFIKKIKRKKDIIKRVGIPINKITEIINNMDNQSYMDFLYLIENTSSKNNKSNNYYWSLIVEELLIRNI